MLKIISAFVVFAASAIAPLSAQGVLEGRVVSVESGSGVPGATVSVESAGVGTTTDGEGDFRLFGIAAGRVTVQVDRIGYLRTETSAEIGGTSADFLVIALEEDVVALAPVVVMGEKVGRGLEATLASVAVIRGDELLRTAVDDLEELFRLVPNVSDADWIDAGILIRGINSEGVGGPSGSPLATVYVDGIAQTRDGARRGALGMWDVGQVEIWRGPQSTLSGRNSLAGKLEVRTNDPTMTWEGAVQGQYGNSSLDREAVVVSGPVIADVLAVRVAAERRHRDGEIEYPLYEGLPRIEQRAADDYNQIRGKLLVQPAGGSVRALLTLASSYDSPAYSDVDGASADGSAAGIAGPVSFSDRYWGLQTLSVFDEARATRNRQAALDVALPLGVAWTVNSLSGWLNTDTRRPSVDLSTDGQIDEIEWSQELRATYSGQRFASVFGVYALTGETDDDRRQQRPWESFLRQDRRDASFTNVALFGEARWSVTPALTFIAGARYDREEQEFASINSRLDPATNDLVSETSNQADSRFDALLPKIGIAWEVGGGTVGATVQRAYRAGGAAIDFVNSRPYAYDPEYAWNYEVGWHGLAAEGQLRYGANLFYLDWRDQQINVPQIPGDFSSDIILNAGESTVRGVELEVAGRPTQRLEAFGSLGIAKTEFEDFAFVLGGSELDLAGESFPQSPEVTTSAGVTYRFPVGAFASADVNYTGEALSRSILEGATREDLPAYSVANLRLGWDGGPLLLTAFVENLLDQEYFRYRYDSGGTQFATIGASRSVGIMAQVSLR